MRGKPSAPGRSSAPVLMAPPHASCGGAPARLPGGASFPSIERHLVEPETTRHEVVRGERVLAQPALAPHADRHCELDYVVRGHVCEGYVGSTDMISRVGSGSDFATDTSIRRQGKDPSTGERWLEEVAFEVVHEQSLKSITERAEDLATRGVRRVLAIFVKKGEVKEWSRDAREWRALDLGGLITDPCLVKPLPVQALLDAAAADDEVARALEAKNNPAIVAMKAASERRGEERGARQEAASAVLAVLAGRQIEVPARVRAAIQGSPDLATLRRWLLRAATAASADDVIADP